MEKPVKFTMRRRVYLLCVGVGIFTFPLSPAHAGIPVQQQYLNIYLKINEAEHLEKQGDFRGALDDFKDCYAKLLKIHNSDPDWETALVVKRIEDCRAEIDQLTPKAAAQLTSPVPAPTPAPVPVAPSSPQTTIVSPVPSNPPPGGTEPDDVATLKQQLADVKQRLDDMTAKYQNTQIENQTLHAQLNSVNSQLAALKQQESVDERVGKLLTENTALTDKLAAAEKELDALKANPKSNLTKVEAQLKNATDRLDAAQAQNLALQQTTMTLKEQLDQAQSDLNVANQKLAAAGAGTPEYETLKRENEIMRDILTRELQEQAHRDMAKRLYQEEFDRLKITSKVLQEQVDILSSPMTPPTNEQERALLLSLKVSGENVTQPPVGGNVLSAPAAGTTPVADAGTSPPTVTPTPAMADNTTPPPSTNSVSDTNVVSNLTPPSPVPTPAATTSQPPITVASNNVMPATTNVVDNSTPPPTTLPTPTPTPASMTDTNSPPATPSLPPTTPSVSSTDTNVVSTPTPPSTTVPGTTPTYTPPSMPPALPPATTDTNPASTPPTPPSLPSATPPPSSDTTNAPTVTQLPPTTTTITDTTIQNNPGTNAAPGQADPTQFASKPRLPDDMRDTAQQAADLFKMQRYDEAAAKYQTIIDKYPESLYAWSNLGVVRFQQGSYDQALKALQQAVKLSPTDAFSYSNLGIVYYQMGQYENAISALERADALDPNDAKTHNYLGCACSQKGWQEVAEREFLKAIAIDDTFGDAHFNLALVYATEKPPSMELARRHYNRALELGIAKDARLEKLLQ